MPGFSDLFEPHKGDDTSTILHKDAAVKYDRKNADRDAARDGQRDDNYRDGSKGVPDNSAGRSKEDDDEDIPPLCTRLMLSSELLGAEAGLSFSQLYTIPNLQTLGMPISRVSLTGLISGPLAILLLPLMGWCSDRGTNPSWRRTVTIIVSTTIIAIGALTVITTNIVHTHLCAPHSNDSFNANFSLMLENSNLGQINFKTAPSRGRAKALIWGNMLTNREFNDSNIQQEMSTVCFPEAKGLAMMGYILIEVGYDTGISSIKTWMLTCNLPKGASSVLVAGLLLTASGGMLTAGLGMVDLPSALGMTSVPPLAFQTTVQAAVVVITLVAGMIISLNTGHRLLRERNQRLNSVKNTAIIGLPRDENNHSSVDPNQLRIVAKVAASSHLSENTSDFQEMETTGQTKFGALRFKDDFEEYYSLSTHIVHSYGTLESDIGGASSSESLGPPQDDRVNNRKQMLLEEESPYSKPSPCCNWRRRFGFKTTMCILWLSGYFGVGAITLFVQMSSDFVGKAICGGDPSATIGSVEKENYNLGLRMASYGVLVNYGVYLAFSFVQKRVLAIMGYTLELVTMTLLLSLSLVLLALTESLEMYFLMTAVYGAYKAVFQVVPLSVASDLVNYEVQRGNDSLKMGGATSLIVMGLPVAYLTLYAWVGTVIDVTGVLATPMLLAALYGLLSAVLFFMLGI